MEKFIDIEIKYKNIYYDCEDKDDEEISDCIRLCNIVWDDDFKTNLLNYDEEIVTDGGFYILFDAYLEVETKKYYDYKSIKLGDLIKLVYDEYSIYDEQGKIMYHAVGDFFVEDIRFHKNSKTFVFGIGS